MSAHYQLPEEPYGESFVVDTPRGLRFETPQIESVFEAIDPDDLEWLWAERIPQRRLTLIEGAPDCGKSFVALSMAAIASSGAVWPDGPEPLKKGGQTPRGGAFVSEDTACRSEPVPVSSEGPEAEREPLGVLLLPGVNYLVDDTVFERLDRAGARLENCHCFTEMSWRTDPRLLPEREIAGVREIVFPHDIPALVHLALRVCNPKPKLIVIDPLTDYCPERRLIGRTIRKLNQAAADVGVAIVATLAADVHRDADGHLKVRPRGDDDAARCIWCIEEDPDDRERRLFVPRRMTFCERLPEGIAFRLKDGLVSWEKQPAGAALPPWRPLSEAAKWLRDVLGEKDLPAAELFRQAREFGFSPRMLHWARRRIGASIYRTGFGPEGRWVWSVGAGLPAEDEATDPAPVRESGEAMNGHAPVNRIVDAAVRTNLTVDS